MPTSERMIRECVHLFAPSRFSGRRTSIRESRWSLGDYRELVRPRRVLELRDYLHALHNALSDASLDLVDLSVTPAMGGGAVILLLGSESLILLLLMPPGGVMVLQR